MDIINEFSISDIQNMCRICMNYSKWDDAEHINLVNIFKDDIRLPAINGNRKKIKLVEALASLTTLKININDDLPKNICINCKQNLIVAYNLKLKSEESASKYQTILLFGNPNNHQESTETSPPQTLKTNNKIDYVTSMAYNATTGDIIFDDNPSTVSSQDNEELLIVINSDGTIDSRSIIPAPTNADKVEILNEIYTDEPEDPAIIADIDRKVQKQLKELKSNNKRKQLQKSVKNLKVKKEKIVKDDLMSPEKNDNSDVQRERKHVCEVCDKKFAGKFNLIEHLRMHAELKLYNCEYCDKAFVQRGNYLCHLRIHTKERPYQCKLCPKNYNQSSALKVHIRSHTNERNYQCDTCNKSFTNASDLGKHKRIHFDVKPYKCDHCTQRFTQKYNMRKHINVMHTLKSAKVKNEK